MFNMIRNINHYKNIVIPSNRQKYVLLQYFSIEINHVKNIM